jgi:hypothetical protein
MKLEDLKKELSRHNTSRVVNKFILSSTPVCFGGDIDLILELKETLSKLFNVHVKEIEIVGSAKLGVCLSSERYGKPFDQQSDIDLVIVSSELFDLAWHELLEFDFQYYKLTDEDRAFLEESYQTIHRGFISPDRLPPKSQFGVNWLTTFSELSRQSKFDYREIRGRLFKNWWFAEKYYSIRLNKLKIRRK